MIDKLELLIALARERHFGKAAESCGISQPTLSAAVKSIEEQLGVLIVERGSRFRGFTPEGERVLDWARRIVGDVRTMRQEIKGLRHGLTGTLRLGVIPTALPFVPELSMPFMDRHPAVHLSIVSRSTGMILSALDNLEIDIGITYIDIEPLQRFQTLRLYAERYVLLVAPDHPLAKRKTMTWADANKVPLCLLTTDMQNRRIIDSHLSDAGELVQPVLESNSMTMLHVHVQSGRVATIAALGEGERFDPPFNLTALPMVEPDVTHEIGLVLKAREPHPPHVAAFLAYARRRAR
ncbi:MAG: LysR family transcriptional regulator [Hyphomicrobium sp.]|nr:LysR family transcriptional regulator [Hyphomicrobium sp.]